MDVPDGRKAEVLVRIRRMILGLALASCTASAAPAQTVASAETAAQRDARVAWDGFAIFDSKVSQYDMVDASPFHRDALKSLADAAHAQGLRFGVYYSIMDWPKDGQLALSGVATKPRAVYLLADRKPSSIASVLVLEGAVAGQ